ncbi:MAG: hypothetical protein OXB84_06300, partial [Halobacteriovoraceae bacterium]|nr:hypothetical protein [Halobacteriovoraceae bacterium]
IMEKIVSLRREKNLPVCFTLDAGPNIHLLYPANTASIVESFIEDELREYLHQGRWLADEAGGYPEKNK